MKGCILLLLSADWVLPVTNKPIKKGSLLIEDGKIKAIGPYKELCSQYPNHEIFDFPSAVIMPGFVDLHTHLEYSVFRGACDDLPYSYWKMQVTEKSRNLDQEDWLLSAKLGALETILSGITTINDITDTGASLAAVSEVKLKGIIYYEIIGMNEKESSQIMAKASKEIKDWNKAVDEKYVQIGIAPHSPYSVSPQLIQAVSRYALEEGLKTSIHLSGSRDEFNFVKYAQGPLATEYRELVGWDNLLWQPTGVTPVKYLEQWDILETDICAVHCVQLEERDFDIIQKYDVGIAYCPKCNAKLGGGIAPLPKFIDRNLRIGIGTDSPASSNTMDFFDEMRIGLLLQRGVNQSIENFEAERFVEMATIGGAKVMGWEDRIGSLEVGKDADIIAVDLSHSQQYPLGDLYSALVYSANQEDVIFTMINGEIVFHKGKTLLLNEEEIREASENIRKKLT